MSVLVTAERFLNSLHYKKSPVGNRHPGPECRALEERCGSSTNQVNLPQPLHQNAGPLLRLIKSQGPATVSIFVDTPLLQIPVWWRRAVPRPPIHEAAVGILRRRLGAGVPVEGEGSRERPRPKTIRERLRKLRQTLVRRHTRKVSSRAQ
jgi:hypothetical protein